MPDELRFGAYFARTLDAPGVLWGHIAVIKFPGVPVRVDPHCHFSRIYFLNVSPSCWNLVADNA